MGDWSCACVVLVIMWAILLSYWMKNGFLIDGPHTSRPENPRAPCKLSWIIRRSLGWKCHSFHTLACQELSNSRILWCKSNSTNVTTLSASVTSCVTQHTPRHQALFLIRDLCWCLPFKEPSTTARSLGGRLWRQTERCKWSTWPPETRLWCTDQPWFLPARPRQPCQSMVSDVSVNMNNVSEWEHSYIWTRDILARCAQQRWRTLLRISSVTMQMEPTIAKMTTDDTRLPRATWNLVFLMAAYTELITHGRPRPRNTFTLLLPVTKWLAFNLSYRRTNLASQPHLSNLERSAKLWWFRDKTGNLTCV